MPDTGAQAAMFLIVAQPRTGSNALIARLNHSPDVCCHYELYHPKSVFLHEGRTESRGGVSEDLRSLVYRDSAPLEFLNRHLQIAEGYTFGFKIFRQHNPEVLNTLLGDRQWKKLVVFRANLLDQFLSSEIAIKTKAYVFTEQNNTNHVDRRVEFNLERFKDFVCRERGILNYYISNLQGESYFLEYNTAVRGNLDQVFNWLRVRSPQNSKNLYNLKKQNSSLTESKVINFNELENQLFGSEFDWMITKL